MKIKVFIEVCDNPQCRSRNEVDTELGVAMGYHLGKGQWDTGAGGGPIPATYACSEDCIGPAVSENLRAAMR